MQQISDICKNIASLDSKSKFIWLLPNENIIIIIYYTTILDVIIQCELGREPGGQTSLPDNNLVLLSVNDTSANLWVWCIYIFLYKSSEVRPLLFYN
jgi:hypothetical protein